MEPLTALILLADGVMYVGSMDGNLYALGQAAAPACRVTTPALH